MFSVGQRSSHWWGTFFFFNFQDLLHNTLKDRKEKLKPHLSAKSHQNLSSYSTLLPLFLLCPSVRREWRKRKYTLVGTLSRLKDLSIPDLRLDGIYKLFWDWIHVILNTDTQCLPLLHVPLFKMNSTAALLPPLKDELKTNPFSLKALFSEGETRVSSSYGLPFSSLSSSAFNFVPILQLEERMKSEGRAAGIKINKSSFKHHRDCCGNKKRG